MQPQSPVMLRCHQGTSGGVVEAIKAFPRMEGKLLAITYVLKGSVERVRVPPVKPARRTDCLWQHTCFELFLAVKGSSNYYEFNFSPSTEWAAYLFRGYRQRAASLENDRLAPKIGVRRQADTLELDAVVRLQHLSAVPELASLSLGISAVIEDTDSRLSYWALRHGPGAPDFHNPDNFILHFGRR